MKTGARKSRSGLIFLSVAFCALTAYHCATAGGGSDGLSQKAARAVVQRTGAAPTELHEVQGLREVVVCGTAEGERFIFRPQNEGTLIMESDEPQAKFTRVHGNWCTAQY